ncbi:helix-turn-helix domain-containing protein [Streptomyces spiramyceticus]|uniref:helix-turn-helix domain-containing protein n=1 Tax=Streptomyces spiramyceticus TaxID=299717 RepID=UPI00237C1F49|nr:helix-turn-helix transcriptional regulator [Streptomyces spiramyceticus]
MTVKRATSGRRMRLGVELRKLRERAGMTSTEAAQMLGTSAGQLSNIEVARFGASADRVRALARIYDCSDHAFVEALAGMAGGRQRGWWEEYREILPTSLLDLAEMEHYATALHTAYTSHMPGLLQSADHARDVFRQVVPELSPPEIEHRLSHRIKRQAVLYRADPVPYTAVVHEAALRMRFGGPSVARRQLEHLLGMSEREHITITVIPFDAGGFPGAGQSIAYACGPAPQLDTVHLDQSHGSALLDAEAQLHKYRMVLDRLKAFTLTPEKSRDFIHNIAQQL